MKPLVRTAASLAVLLLAALTAGAAAATDSAALPETAMKISDATAVTGMGEGAPPESRLLRSLRNRLAPPASDSRSLEPAAGIDPDAAGLATSGEPGSSPVPGRSPVAGSSSVLHGCPRTLLNALLASAADADDAVSALAIERETLALCRERQEVVNGIVVLEGELGTLLTEAQAKSAGPVEGAVGSAVVDASIVKVSAPVRVVSLPPPVGAAGEAPKEAEAPEDPAPPSYFWFSIIGTAGDLRAGVRSLGDGSVWFVREGDRLPGDVTVTRIVARPPGVHVGGALKAALPYRPRPAGTAGQRGNAPTAGQAPPGGYTAGDGS